MGLAGTWNLPRPGREPVSSALAGGLLTTDHQEVWVRYFQLPLVVMVLLSSPCDFLGKHTWEAAVVTSQHTVR